MRKGKLFSKNNLIQERKRIDFEFFYTDFLRLFWNSAQIPQNGCRKFLSPACTVFLTFSVLLIDSCQQTFGCLFEFVVVLAREGVETLVVLFETVSSASFAITSEFTTELIAPDAILTLLLLLAQDFLVILVFLAHLFLVHL